MRPILLPLLAVFLLAASCQNTQPPAAPPAPLVAEPPHDNPFTWEYYFSNHSINPRWKPEYIGLEGVNYIEAEDGSWRVHWYGVGGPYQDNPGSDHSLYTNRGCFVHYAQDVSPNQVFGGRRFRWRVCFRLHTEENPWRWEMPTAPPEFTVLDKLPWEESRGYVSKNPRTDDSLWGELTTTPTAPPFVGCLQQAQDDHFYGRGFYMRVFPATAMQFYQLQKAGPDSNTYMWAFFDYGTPGGALSYRGVGMTFKQIDNGPLVVTVLSNSPAGYLRPLPNRTYRMVLLAKAMGIGPYPKPWEKRWWRLWGDDVGAFDRGDHVECHYGNWHLDEVKDPAAIAWLDSFIPTPEGEPPWAGSGTPLHPSLVPDPWR